MAGCSSEPTVTNLPEYEEYLVEGDGGGVVRVNPKTLVPPPPRPPEKGEYGEIYPRAAWSLRPLTLVSGYPMNGVRRMTIHHSGDGKPFMDAGMTATIKHLQIVQQAHLQRGMIDIGYHFAVDRAGRAWQLRSLLYEGQHVRPSKNGTRNNEHNVGVVVLGDFNLQLPTTPQQDRLFGLIKVIRGKYALPTSAVFMHGEIVETACPGKRLEPLIRDARRSGRV
jgi:hypothetical protein